MDRQIPQRKGTEESGGLTCLGGPSAMNGDLWGEGDLSFLLDCLRAARSTVYWEVSPEISSVFLSHCLKFQHQINSTTSSEALPSANMFNHFWEMLKFYYKLPFNLSQQAEFLVAERDEVTLLYQPEDLQMTGREGPRVSVISFKDSVEGRHSFCQLSSSSLFY